MAPTVLHVAPHPDDEAVGCPGALLHLHDRGWTVVSVIRISDKLEDKDAMIEAYEKHNAAVRAGFPKERLIEWTAADGWEPICERLGLPVPAEPFPKVNTTEDFRAMLGMPPLEG